jgi:TRAP-type C4-dicarboxylate transport system substrate-binding protein
MKRWPILCVSILVLFGLLVASPLWVCGAEKKIELKVAIWMPAKSVDTDIAEYWTKVVEEKTKGRVHFTLYKAGALGHMKDHYDIAAKGVADISFVTLAATPGRFPVCEGLHLPLVIPNSEVGGKVFSELYKEFKEIRAEFTEVQVLGLGTVDVWNIQNTKRPIQTMKDFKGLKFRVASGVASEAIKLLGGIPIGMAVPELYLGLQKGVVDGCVMGYEGVKSFKLYELLKYYTDVDGFTTLAQGLFMNKSSFNALPPDIQKIIGEEMGFKWWAEQKGKMFHEKWAKDGKEIAKQHGGKIYYVPAEEKKKWIQACAPIRDEWIKKMDEKGVPSKKILNRAIELVQKYNK